MSWPEKIGGRKITDLIKIKGAQKRPKDLSLQFVGEIPSVMQFFQHFSTIKPGHM
jgi:hypothetical protein